MLTCTESRRALYRVPTGTYYTVIDGHVWQWYHVTGLFGVCPQHGWRRRRVRRFPASARYASNPPDDLLRAVAGVSQDCDVWRYDLARGQEHAKEKS